jgi:hypothetical protein
VHAREGETNGMTDSDREQLYAGPEQLYAPREAPTR